MINGSLISKHIIVTNQNYLFFQFSQVYVIIIALVATDTEM